MKTIPSRISRRKAHAHVKPIIICTDETATPIPVTPTKPVKPVTDVEVIDLTNLPFPGVKKNRPRDINRTLRRILFRHRRTTSTNDSSSDYQTDAVKNDLSSPSGYHSDTNETDASSSSDDTDPTETGLSSPDDDLTNTNNAVLSLRKSNALPAPALPTPQAVVSANNIGLLNDPIYRNCPIDLSQVYLDQNGNEQSHQFLLPMPMKFTGLSSYRSSEMNYLRRWRYGLTRPTAVERFAAMARHQQPVRLIKTQAEITIGQYHELADQFINSLVEQLEALEEQHEEIEVEFNAGVLALTYLPHGVWVINKQPANCQIWLSSPISGPFRFDFKEVETKNFAEQTIKRGKWVDRNGVSLSALLERELQGVLDVLHLEGEDTRYNPKTDRFEEIAKT